MKNIWVSDGLGGHWEAIDGEIELTLGDCGIKINSWKKRFFNSKRNKNAAAIQLRCFYKAPDPILWMYYLELSVSGKIVEQLRIREEAYDVLSRDKPKDEYVSSSVVFVRYEAFTPDPAPPKEKKIPVPKPVKKGHTIWDFEDGETSVLSSL